MNNLSDIQKWFYKSITHPSGVTHGAAEAGTALAMDKGNIVDVIQPSDKLNAADRLAIYHNAYFLRLYGVLEAEYPALKAALGEDLFRKFALFFLQQNPSGSYSLYDLSANFPGFLAQSVPSENAEESWPNFIIDLVRLERLFQESYRGEGTESLPNTDNPDFDESGDGQVKSNSLRISPSLKLMHSTFPVHHYLLSVRRGEDVPLPNPEMTWLAVNRLNYNVKIYELSEDEFLLLKQISANPEIEISNEAVQPYSAKWLKEKFLY
ncbi:MAG: DNA-binding domain-containing protein [Bacteroidia bacterium]|nr:DNA-binding domain-containing protein [Bacteroidia bacterium]